MILDYLIVNLYILSIAVYNKNYCLVLHCSSFHCFLYPYCPRCLDSLLSFHTLLLSSPVLVPTVVTLLLCTAIVVHPIVLCRTIGLTCISGILCTPWIHQFSSHNWCSRLVVISLNDIMLSTVFQISHPAYDEQHRGVYSHVAEVSVRAQ